MLATGLIIFTSCGKDEPAAKTTLQKLQAKWTFQKEYYHDNYSGVDYRDTTYGVATDYADFRTDGKVYFKVGTYLDTAGYSLIGDTKVVTMYGGSTPYNDTALIQVLNDTQLQVYAKEFDVAPDYYEYTDYFTK